VVVAIVGHQVDARVGDGGAADELGELNVDVLHLEDEEPQAAHPVPQEDEGEEHLQEAHERRVELELLLEQREQPVCIAAACTGDADGWHDNG